MPSPETFKGFQRLHENVNCTKEWHDEAED